MAEKDIEIGREYFCREESTKRTGRFSISESGIQTTLFSFDETFIPPQNQTVFLRLENNRIISLHESFSGDSGGGGWVNTQPPMSCMARTIITNIAVAGFSPWPSDEPLWHASFNVPYADELLHHTVKFKAIADSTFSEDVDLGLLEVHAGGMTVKIGYGASGTMNYSRPHKIQPRICIEFDEAENLLSYFRSVNCIVAFLSALHCVKLRPEDIGIRRLTHDEWLDEIKAHRYLGDHSVWYIWPPADVKSNDVWLGRAFAHVRDDEELAAFSACMTAWIDRDEIWSNATNLMMTSFKLQNVMSPERLLTAFKWFEETPDTALTVAIKKDDVDAITAAAAAKSAELGYDELDKRIRGSLSSIKTETHHQRFSRLIADIRATFGQDIVSDDLLDALKKAVGFRGKGAHGHFEPKDETEYYEFTHSIYALECLCYLLMLKDLPINPKGRERVKSSNPVQNFHQSLVRQV